MDLEIKTLNNVVFAKLNLEFYNFDSINNSIEDFKELCEIYFDKDSSEISVKSLDDELSSKEVYLEFMNYVLGNMKNGETA